MKSLPATIASPLKLYQIELTSYCDMKCSYCPHPEMERGKGHMSPETLAECIAYAKKMGQTRLVVHHFGEPLLHPHLKERLLQIAHAGMEIEFSTNGLLLEKRLPMLLEIPGKIIITLSMHQWADQPSEQYFEALEMWRERAKGTNIIFQKAFNALKGKPYRLHDWLQFPQAPRDYYKACDFLRENWGVVLWDGRIVSCCADHEGKSVHANIYDDDLSLARSLSWKGCDNCSLLERERKDVWFARRLVWRAKRWYAGRKKPASPAR